MSRYFELAVTLGLLWTAGALGVPLVIAAFGFSRVRELGPGEWQSDSFVLTMAAAFVGTAIFFWVPLLESEADAGTHFELPSRCTQLEASESIRELTLEERIEYIKLDCGA